MSFRPNPNLEAELLARLQPVGDAVADELAQSVKDNVSAGSRSGRQYRSSPRRSSAPNEYPQEQTGDFKDSIRWRQVSPTRWEVFSDDDPRKVIALELGTANMEERAPFRKTLYAEETARRLVARMREVL